MDCVVCKERAAVSACIECGTKVCGQCGKGCQYCGRGVCPEHRMALPSGRGACPSCAKSHATEIASMQNHDENAPTLVLHVTPQPHATAQHPIPLKFSESKSDAAATSFSDLMEGLDDIADHVATDKIPSAAVPVEKTDAPSDTNLKEDDPDDLVPDYTSELRSKISAKGELKNEALTGSCALATPTWVTSLTLGIVASLAVTPIALSTGFRFFQPWLSYIIVLVGLFATSYAVGGLAKKKDPPEFRKRCFAGLTLGLISIVVAILYRSPY